ncbi:MAG: hypothetical protein HYY17_15975 [Planctomycetes bacterium]|nr:hypothetical protein [Planctomycetota bacterium]
MLRLAWVPLLLLAACAPVAGRRAPPIPDPPDSGAVLYVLEGDDELFDDGAGGYRILSPFGDGHFWVGEQALRSLLRWACRRHGRLLRAERFFPRDGQEVRLHPDEPVEYVESAGDGLYCVRRCGTRAGLDLRMTAHQHKDGKYVDVNYTIKRVWARRACLAGTDLEAGAPRFETQYVGSNKRTFPTRGSLLFVVHRGEGRMFAVLLYVASVDP